MENSLPDIPPKRYFTIGEVSELCGVKPYVLRYWEQEFTQLRPMKRRGNRRYYQHHEVLLIRRIRDLLYEKGFTISGARNRLAELGSAAARESAALSLPQTEATADEVPSEPDDVDWDAAQDLSDAATAEVAVVVSSGVRFDLSTEVGHAALRAELLAIKELLKPL